MSSQPASIVVSALFVLSSFAISGAQSQTKPDTSTSTPQQPYVIRSASRLVQVSVIVHDKKANPIPDLKKEDFALLDAGRPQQIAFFAAPVPAHSAPQPLAADVFTNRSDLKGQDPGATIVILFDELNTSFLDQAYARQHILRFLRTVKPQDHVAIFALTTQLITLHDFSDDMAALQNSVERFSPRLMAAFDASHPDDFHVPAADNDPALKAFENRVNNANAEIADSRVIDIFRIGYCEICGKHPRPQESGVGLGRSSDSAWERSNWGCGSR
jgi:VWFA-related protein